MTAKTNDFNKDQIYPSACAGGFLMFGKDFFLKVLELIEISLPLLSLYNSYILFYSRQPRTEDTYNRNIFFQPGGRMRKLRLILRRKV